MKKTIFVLEFNEKQQNFHLQLRSRDRDENTWGWRTVLPYCTDEEWKLFRSFIGWASDTKLTVDDVNRALNKMRLFLESMEIYDFTILKGGNKFSTNNLQTPFNHVCEPDLDEKVSFDGSQPCKECQKNVYVDDEKYKAFMKL